ncbi:MAG TPA: hypothetical protein VF659_09365 [Pyrinomonadaceae bacterium]|jgi:hypothetical protein
MTTSREWLAALSEKVRLKNERVRRLEGNGEKAVDELRAAVEKDVEYINREVYLHEDPLQVHADSAFGFRVTNTNTQEMSLVELRPKDETLYVDTPRRRPLILFADSGGSGDVLFSTDSERRVSAEELSRLILEPLVKSEYGLD